MLRLSLYLVCIYCFLMRNQYVFCQYGNNEMYNQFDRQIEPPNNYLRDSGGAYNQQQSRSYQSDESEKPMPYQFGYNIDDGYGNKQDRQEKGDEYGNVKGSYGYMDSNGVYRQVEYTAGPKIGFVAKINSNEPSLKNKANPADVIYNVEETPRSSYMKQQSSNNNQYNMNQMIDNQLGEQIMRMFDNNNRYVTNSENSYGMMKPMLAMIRLQADRKQNDDYYNSDSNANDMQSYASHRVVRRRYYY